MAGTEIAAGPFAEQQLVLTVVGAFAGIALLLAAMGIFGVLSQAVTRRRRDLCLRIALGAWLAAPHLMVVGRGLARGGCRCRDRHRRVARRRQNARRAAVRCVTL